MVAKWLIVKGEKKTKSIIRQERDVYNIIGEWMVPRDLRWDLKQWPIIEEAAPWLSATGEGCILAKAAVPAHIPPRHAHLRDLVDSSDTDCFPDKASIPLLCFKHTLECLSSRASHFSLSRGKHFLKLTQEEEHSGVGGGALGAHSSDLPPREPAVQRELGRQPPAAASSDLLWCSHQVHALPGTAPSM